MTTQGYLDLLLRYGRPKTRAGFVKLLAWADRLYLLEMTQTAIMLGSMMGRAIAAGKNGGAGGRGP